MNRLELPPRARRILILLSLCDVVVGTTSACAENTRDQAVHQNDSWNYLRVRGEYVNGSRVWVTRSELPPRARRIHGDYLVEKPEYGTTSACAENTVNLCGLRRITRNYLRVRGEYSPPAARVRSSKELPPRARRIHTVDYLLRQIIGTTSACAENTVPDIAILRPPGNYLRVRGEYSPVSPIGRGLLELPPRARRILVR